MNFFSRHKLGLIITGIIILSVIVVACGGGGSGASSIVTGVVDVVSPPALKNEGGITYTKKNLAGVDANSDGVDDATASRLSNMYSSQPAVLSAFMRSAKLDRDLLSIPDAKLPKTKAEADALINNNTRDIAGCIEFRAAGIEHIEDFGRKYYYTVFDTTAKRLRLREIETLSGYTSRDARTCDEILGTQPI